MPNLECPVDFISINENKARITALHIFVLSIIYLFTTHWLIPAIWVIDFATRAFNFGRYSLLARLSDLWIKLFAVRNKPTDLAPKRFSARIGLIITAAVLLLNIAGFTTASWCLSLLIVVFSFLESFVNFCAGCWVYTYYKKLFKARYTVMILFVLVAYIPLHAQTGNNNPPAKTEAFTIENYYKVKWGYADEFISLWKKNHYPLLKKLLEKGDVLSIKAEEPIIHSSEDSRWDFKVTLVFKNAPLAFDYSITEPYKKELFPDQEAYKKAEQHRFELLLAHWDVPVESIALP